MARLRRLLFVLPRLVALLATSYLLIATSAPAEYPYCGGSGGCGGSNQTRACTHASQSVTFHAAGTCGPSVDIVVSSAANECLIIVQGAGPANLPSAGRFEAREHPEVSLLEDTWTLSGYLPEDALPDGGAPQPGPTDAGVFTVVQDAQASKDLGGFSVTPSAGGESGSHATPTLRTCTAWPKDSTSLTLECSGGGVPSCQAILTRR